MKRIFKFPTKTWLLLVAERDVARVRQVARSVSHDSSWWLRDFMKSFSPSLGTSVYFPQNRVHTIFTIIGECERECKTGVSCTYLTPLVTWCELYERRQNNRVLRWSNKWEDDEWVRRSFPQGLTFKDCRVNFSFNYCKEWYCVMCISNEWIFFVPKDLIVFFPCTGLIEHRTGYFYPPARTHQR